jgi:hypothetical protein
VKQALLIATFFIFAGAAQAQYGSTINNYQSYNNAGGLEGAGALNSHPSSSSSSSAAPATENVSGTNTGEFVPSTFASYKEAVADARANADKKPMTLADIARQSQAEKKAAEPKQAMLLEQNSDGKLIITNPKKQ